VANQKDNTTEDINKVRSVLQGFQGINDLKNQIILKEVMKLRVQINNLSKKLKEI
jgi:hypothetical protein